MTDQEIFTLAQLREALGVDEKPMLAELPEIARQIKRDADRYAKLKKLLPDDFATLIDAWHEKSSLSANKQ